MTTRERLEKNLLFFLIAIYYLGGYFFINLWTASRESTFKLALPFEPDIPFIPWLIFAYVLIFGFIATAYLFIDDLPFFRRVAKAFFLCITIHFIIFLILPVEYTLRPALNPHESWLIQFIHFYYWLDLPYNCFPSMHISNAFLVAFIFERYRPGLGRILHPLALLVALSVVLVKQHYIADVVAGFGVSWFVIRAVFGKEVNT